MRWNELDIEARIWTIGRERTKADRALVVPLSQPALEIIELLPRFGSAFLFPATRARKLAPGMSPAQARASKPMSGFNSGKRECDRLIAAAGHEMTAWRWHDLRRTLRSNLARLRIPSDVAEAVIGHVIPGVRGVYDRHDYLREKAEALEAWATLLRDILDPSSNVVRLRS